MKDISSSQYSIRDNLDSLTPQMPIVNWSVLLPDPLRDRSLEALYVIAERLRDPEHVLSAVERAKAQSDEFFWGGASLTSSFGSLALFYLFLSRSFPNQGWEDLAHMYLRLAAQATNEHPLLHPGLFSGSTGFAFILSLFCQDESRYQKTFERTLDDALEQILNIPALKQDTSHSIPNTDYEAISGVAGILAFLISLSSPTYMIQDSIKRLLDYLVWLSDHDESGRVRWFISPEHLPTFGPYHNHYPNGYFNLGLSHGIPGPLAALSLAWQAGYRVPGQRAAIERISSWLIEHQVSDRWGLNWPSGIPLELSQEPQRWNRLQPTRAAWCYGAPGILAALSLAGCAITDEALQHLALKGLEVALNRPIETQNIDSPTICHGISGLLAISLRFAHMSSNQSIKAHLSKLVGKILDACSSRFLLGVRDEARQDQFVDDPGFLTGASGVGLVLLAAATPVAPQWDRALLIA